MSNLRLLGLFPPGTLPRAPPTYGLQNHSLAVSAASSALTISLKDNAGNDPSASSPVSGWFRNVTGTTGSWTQLTVTGALSLVVSSGSTLGVTSTTAFRLWVVLFNNGGTARLGVVNCLLGTPSAPTGLFPLMENYPTSSTAEGGAGAADSSGVIYTGTAVSSKSFLIVGYIEWDATGLTAGTWTTTHVNFIQTFGAGIKTPGDTVQIATGTVAVQTITSSTSFVSTGMTVNIAPTSAANLTMTSWSSDANNGAINNEADARLHRGSTAIGPSYVVVNNGAAGGVSGMSQVDLLDAPGTTSTTTYVVKIKAPGAAPIAIPQISGIITVREIMA